VTRDPASPELEPSDAANPAQRHPIPKRKGGRRTAARVAAVQALYQMEMSAMPAVDVIAEFRAHRLDIAAGGEGEPGDDKPDKELFAAIAASASVRREEIDGLIRSALADGWSIERLDAVMRALLRAGVCELLDFADVPARVIIDQYVDVAHAFLAAKEAGFINGMLDRLARRLRPSEVKSSSSHGRQP
jgi:N utilization substance protein B